MLDEAKRPQKGRERHAHRPIQDAVSDSEEVKSMPSTGKDQVAFSMIDAQPTSHAGTVQEHQNPTFGLE